MSNTKKKRIAKMHTVVTNVEELKEATEIITAVENMLATKYERIEFVHLLSWWLNCEPADA